MIKERNPSWKWFAVALSLLVLCGILTYIGACQIGTACTPDRDFNAVDLSLPHDLFPENARVRDMSRPSTSEGAFEKGSMGANWNNADSNATYQVWRFRTIGQAEKLYSAESFFATQWSKPEMAYVSETADEFAVACNPDTAFGSRCRLAARYLEYVIVLNVNIDSMMTITAFNEIVAFIDKQMTKRLELAAKS